MLLVLLRLEERKGLLADLGIGRTGPPDKACIISKGPCIYTHLYIIEL